MATKLINVSEIKGHTRLNPFEYHTWMLWINHNKKLVAVSSSGARQRDSWVFEVEENDTIGLYNGMNDAYAYIRSGKFQNFLNKYGIDKVIKCDPNKTHTVHEHRNIGSDSGYALWTDGTLNEGNSDLGRTMEWRECVPNTACYELSREVVVEDSTYVVIQQGFHKTLYTVADIFNLDLEVGAPPNIWGHHTKGDAKKYANANEMVYRLA